MTSQEIEAYRLALALIECTQHVHRLQYVSERVRTLFPLTEHSLQELSEEQVGAIDQLLYRFGKLQDALGIRLYPSMLRLGQEWRDEDTFLDKLYRLEKLGVLESAARWIALRDIRNRLTHEYPDNPQLKTVVLNATWDCLPTLLATFERGKSYADRHFGALIEQAKKKNDMR